MCVADHVFCKDLLSVGKEGARDAAASQPEVCEVGVVGEDADPDFWGEGRTDGRARGVRDAGDFHMCD